jgi:hypothetical protein
MNYQINEQLCEILLENRFVDITSLEFPREHLLMQRDGYNPATMHRRFCYKKYNESNFITFNYQSLVLTAGGQSFHLGFASLTEEELRAIIAFYQLHPLSRRALLKKERKELKDLHQLIKEMDKMPEIFNGRRHEQFKEAYRSVKL